MNLSLVLVAEPVQPLRQLDFIALAALRSWLTALDRLTTTFSMRGIRLRSTLLCEPSTLSSRLASKQLCTRTLAALLHRRSANRVSLTHALHNLHRMHRPIRRPQLDRVRAPCSPVVRLLNPHAPDLNALTKATR